MKTPHCREIGIFVKIIVIIRKPPSPPLSKEGIKRKPHSRDCEVLKI